MIKNDALLNGVMLNAYPDSVGEKFADAIAMLQMPAFKNTFSLFYILPTIFNSDLDRGFSIIDYNINEKLVSLEDLKNLKKLNIKLKFDIVLNHLSVASPQFKDLLAKGEDSVFKDFFINWNEFWQGQGKLNTEGVIIPNESHLNKLFMRKTDLPILKVPFPDGSQQPYWNTFYQKQIFNPIELIDLSPVCDLTLKERKLICKTVNKAIYDNEDLETLQYNFNDTIKNHLLSIIHSKSTFLGQMDVNAKSPFVWEFYENTISKLKDYGCTLLRLDAFAYLHKEIGETNFFNIPETWSYLSKIKEIADQYEIKLLPEIHVEYGLNLHKQVAEKGYYIYDFFLPGLLIHTLEKAENEALLAWVNEIQVNNYKTINMLGCHDGIPVLDLKGKEIEGKYHNGLLKDNQIDDIIKTILERGGQVKNLYDSDGNKIAYYQINATYFSALGESEEKLLLARAIQLFLPGIPQIWYLDLFAGTNDYEAVKKSETGGHKEINRTTLTKKDIISGLKRDIVLNQLTLIRLRNTLNAFKGEIEIIKSFPYEINIKWKNKLDFVDLKANLKSFKFSINYNDGQDKKRIEF